MFINVCFKDSSSAFQVFGCFLLLCVEVHSLFQDFCITKKKTINKRTKKKKGHVLSSTHWAVKLTNYHYSQIGISSLISADLKTEDTSFFFSSNIVHFGPSCCAIISVVAFFFLLEKSNLLGLFFWS